MKKLTGAQCCAATIPCAGTKDSRFHCRNLSILLASLVEGLQDPSNPLILLKVGRFAKYAVNPGISVDMLGQTLKSF